jgi:hypothetical protein
MVEEILLSEDIAAGRNVIEALDKAKFPVDAAFKDTLIYRTAA